MRERHAWIGDTTPIQARAPNAASVQVISAYPAISALVPPNLSVSLLEGCVPVTAPTP
ncbi:hypothetical protein [Gulosibacter sp. 10]|uniref:hypothetical protein n=1 Tax=Gulosibacter sp. 10 TaxID=1255570 RepID=UPI0015961131|nr:hypothetical protein [Gulosibacter sp. 10]